MVSDINNLYYSRAEVQEYAIKEVCANPKVSIIVPSYNVEMYFAKCLMSLIKQTLKEIEIIIVDDGSTDSTYSIACAFAEEDKRIKVIKQTNQKQGAARNRGLDIAKGEFIGFVDSDDWVDLDYFEKMYNAVIENNVNMAAASMSRDKKDKAKVHLALKEKITCQGASNIVRALCRHLETAGKIYKREIVKDLRFGESVLYEDAPYTIRAIHLCNSLVTVPDTTYHYFSNPKSTVKKSLSPKNENDKISTNLDLINYCEENNIDIGNWEVLKERHLLWAIKHYKYHKDFYLFGIKIFTKNIPFDNSKTFVVYNTACFGDVLLCNSLCQNIKNIFPNSKTVFITDKNFKDVAMYQKDVDEVVIYDKKDEHKGLLGLIKFIRDFKYKKCYASIITYNNQRNWLISRLSGSKHVIMADRKKSDLTVQEKHNLLLQSLTNKNVKNYPIKYQVTEDVKESVNEILQNVQDYVVLCTTSKRIEKDMPIDTAIELINKFNTQGLEVVYVGAGAKAIEHSEKLKSADCDFLNLTNKTSIPQLGAVIENAKCLISVDTGTMHLGCAVDTPTVVLFYEQDMIKDWAPKADLYKSTVLCNEKQADKIFESIEGFI